MPKGAATGAGYLTIRDPRVKFLIAASIPPLRAITPGSRIFVRSAHSSGTRITLIRAGTVAIEYRVEAVGARATEQGVGPERLLAEPARKPEPAHIPGQHRPDG